MTFFHQAPSLLPDSRGKFMDFRHETVKCKHHFCVQHKSFLPMRAQMLTVSVQKISRFVRCIMSSNFKLTPNKLHNTHAHVENQRVSKLNTIVIVDPCIHIPPPKILNISTQNFWIYLLQNWRSNHDPHGCIWLNSNTSPVAFVTPKNFHMPLMRN